jgi:hypothetical protein
MALLYGAKFLQQQASSNLPHVFGFGTVRSVADDTLLEVWNGATSAARVNAIDKDGKLYSAAAAAGDVLYAVTGGVTSVRRFDSLAIGTNAQVLTVNSGATAPQWSSVLTLADGAVGAPTYAFLSATNSGMYLDGSANVTFGRAGQERLRIGGTAIRAYGAGAQQSLDFYYDANVPLGQTLTAISQYGNDGTGSELLGGEIRFIGGEAWGVGARGTRIALMVPLTGSTTLQFGLQVNPTSTEMQLQTYSTASFWMGTKQIFKTRVTGWSQPTGIADRSTFATGSVTLSELAERVKALIDDLHIDSGGHGLIGLT